MPEDVCYHVAGSDKELVQQVNNLLQEEGAIFVRDKLGNSHYLVDGSRGPLQAGRAIQRQNLIREVMAPRQWASSFQLERYQDRPIYHELEQWLDQGRLISETLERHPFDRSLQGYTILKFALACLIPDQSLMKPVKALYHLCAQEHQTSVACIERNLRSLFKRLAKAEHQEESKNGELPTSYQSRPRVSAPLLAKAEQYTNVACLCRLFDEMYRIFHGYWPRMAEAHSSHSQLGTSPDMLIDQKPGAEADYKLETREKHMLGTNANDLQQDGANFMLDAGANPSMEDNAWESSKLKVSEPAPFTVRDVAQGKYSIDIKPKMGPSGIRQLAAAYEKYLAAEQKYRQEGTAQGQVNKELMLARLQSVYAAVHEDIQSLLRLEGNLSLEGEKRHDPNNP